MFAITCICSIGVYIFSGFDSSLKEIKYSIATLNISIAKILEREENQKKANEYFARRIKDLEDASKDRWTKSDHKDYAKAIELRFKTLIDAYSDRFENIERKLFRQKGER